MGEPLFNWIQGRSAGVLLHPTSLPNQYLIGNFGESSKSFVERLLTSGMRYWQMLPLGPTGFGESPYQSYSSHAINPYLLDWDALIKYGWMKPLELKPLHSCHSGKVDFDELKITHAQLRQKGFRIGLQDNQFKTEYEEFKKTHNFWVYDYALFMSLKEVNQGKIWNKWKKSHREYLEAKNLKLSAKLRDAVELVMFEQFILLRQWNELKFFANQKGLEIIGDIPIYVSPDSVDVWANREVFQLTKAGAATKLAGVPPDYFNEEGQFWGNPLYNWKHLKETGYTWWIDRLRYTLSLFNVVRFDHFRALASYWSIPAKATSAKEGKWVKGPGIEFFNKIREALPEAKLILEDLGEITPDVIKLKNATGCPGLSVLQFAFGGGSDNFYLPHNVNSNTVIYTGTHDNDTSLGWYQTADERTKDHFRRYIQVSGDDACWDLIRTAYSSNAAICIIPVQDILNLDSRSRMNTPGVASGNWAWRMNNDQIFRFTQDNAEYLRYLAGLYGRI